MQNRRVLLFVAVFILAAISVGTACSNAPRPAIVDSKSQSTPDSLSAAGQQELHTLVESGRLGDLQWPNFSEHRDAVKEFYDLATYKLAWSNAGKLTPQATELIGILEDADQKGLDNKDYDGARWSGTPASPADPVGRQ